MTDNRPRYEPVTFSTGVNVSSEDLDTLNRAGLPRYGLGSDDAVDVPIGVDVPGYGYLICFARGVRDYYFDPMTGVVLAMRNRPEAMPIIVNTTLEQYSRTVKALIEAFPFYDNLGGRDPNEIDVDILGAEYEASAARLADRIRAIDPAVLGVDGHWDRFLVDVMHGDYWAEDFLHVEAP